MEETKKCHYCGEEILAVAKKCKHCGEWLDSDATTVQKEKSENYNGYWIWLLGTFVLPYSHWVLRNQELTKKWRIGHKFNLIAGILSSLFIVLPCAGLLLASDYEIIG